MPDKNSMKDYFLNNQGFFYGAFLTLLILLLAKFVFFDPCCPVIQPGPDPDPGISPCAPEGTTINISADNLSVRCNGDVNCFNQFNNKIKIISHQGYYAGVVGGQGAEDPLYIGNRLCTGGTSEVDCNEPPTSFMPSGKNKGFDYTAGGPFADILTVNPQDPLLSFNGCNFEGFLTICMLDVSYQTVAMQYGGPCPIAFLKCANATFPLVCGTQDEADQISWLTGYPNSYFTIETNHENETFYISILRTSNPNKVFRVAYKNPDDLNGYFTFEP